jgi:hypothetical protein
MAQFMQRWTAVQDQAAEERARRNRKWIYISLAGGVVIVGGVLLWKKLSKATKAAGAENDLAALLNTNSTGVVNTLPDSTSNPAKPVSNQSNGLPPATTPAVVKEDFPLKVGSKNKFVGQLQYALNDLFGAGLVTDSDLGSKTKAALEKQDLKLPLEQDAYYVIVDKYLERVGTKLFDAGVAGNYTKCKELLSTMLIPYDYTLVSNVFKQKDFLNGAKMTLVTGMLRRFDTPAQQAAIETQFLRMGLVKKSDGKWAVPTLSGLEQFNVLTVADTVVTLPDDSLIPVEKAVMLGRMTAMDASYVYLENGGLQMKVPWEMVKVLA